MQDKSTNRKDKTRCQLHRWLGYEYCKQVTFCRACNVNLCNSCYRLFHNERDIVDRKIELKLGIDETFLAWVETHHTWKTPGLPEVLHGFLPGSETNLSGKECAMDNLCLTLNGRFEAKLLTKQEKAESKLTKNWDMLPTVSKHTILHTGIREKPK